MANVSDITNTPLSGINYIDALLDKGPDWNYLTPAGNVLQYTFSITSGNEQGQGGQEAFTLSQQNCVRTALDYISKLTGILFSETTMGTAAQIHFANINILDNPQTTGLCSWTHTYTYGAGNVLATYDADAYVYLDNVEWRAENRDLTPGTYGYETLLHELGHALGLKHPFLDSGDAAGTPVLPAGQDNTGNTIMSYTDSGGPHASYSQYDIAALNWLYGADGLGGLGVSSATGARYLTGTSANDTLTGTGADDTLEGDGGNDTINGGAGNDTAVFRGAVSSYTFTQLANGDLQATSALDGTDILSSIELFRFSDGSYQRSQLVNDTTPPAAPTISVSKNAAGYAMGNAPLVSGSAEANSTVNLYSNGDLVGTAHADASGLWSVTTTPFRDGMNYLLYARATDASGNTSGASETVHFNIDATPPKIPTGTVVATAGGNQPVFDGTGEAGSTIQLFRTSDFAEIARATVGTNGTWHIDSAPLPNGSYDISFASVDAADNATSSGAHLGFTIASTLNTNGTANADVLRPAGTGNNAIDGGAGVDVAVYDTPRANFTIAKDVFGYAVTDKVGSGGHDTLVNVERVQFSDNSWVALDVDGVAGQAYRMYKAAFDRVPDLAGLGFWVHALDNGYTLTQVADEFVKSSEFKQMYMSDPSDANFITKLYEHVLHRAPEGAGYDWWLDHMHSATRAEVLAFFTESPENQAQVIGTIQDGIPFTHW
jgi:hypothetical protein